MKINVKQLYFRIGSRYAHLGVAKGESTSINFACPPSIAISRDCYLLDGGTATINGHDGWACPAGNLNLASMIGSRGEPGVPVLLLLHSKPLQTKIYHFYQEIFGSSVSFKAIFSKQIAEETVISGQN